MKKILKDILYFLFPGVQSVTAFFLMVLALLPAIAIFIHSKDLGFFFFPAFFGYSAILAGIYAHIMHRRAMLDTRALAGDELYYRLYPKEKIRDERIRRIRNLFQRH